MTGSSSSDEPTGLLALDTLPASARIGAGSAALAALPGLTHFFGDRDIVPLSNGCAGAIGWGMKSSGEIAAAFARRTGQPFARLEDGFMRSVGLGKHGAPSVSIVADDVGIYYDAAGPSRLEHILLDRAANCAHIRRRGAAALERWREEGLSKYNVGHIDPPDGARGRIILVDQVAGDRSLQASGAGAGQRVFSAMLARAREEGHDGRIALRAHPDVLAGKAKGFLADAAIAAGIPIIADHCTPKALLAEALGVWTVSSALGFEALLHGVPVTTFAAPFYAGWGLTRDLADTGVAMAAFARRGRHLDVVELFAATFLLYARYADPIRRKACDFDTAVDRILDWRARDQELAGPRLICFGFSPWKRRNCAALLAGSNHNIQFRGAPNFLGARHLPRAGEANVLVWGQKETAGFRRALKLRGLGLSRVEDGFIRSVGLGSDLLGPGSLVLDGEHLYFDIRRRGRLEQILATEQFSPALRRRAESLIDRLIDAGVTKYNLGTSAHDLRAQANGRSVVLVAEQVPDDAAIRYGGGIVAPNLGLLRAVRNARPEAFIVYKEHPDLVSGNRRGRVPVRSLLDHADAVLSTGDLGPLYAQIDEIHVISSLAGFEALLRGVKVTTWGVPFYAGWGLTEDRAPCRRRTRRLSLPELVAGALILYPRYIDPVTLIPCSVEEFVDIITSERAAPALRHAPRSLSRPRRYISALLGWRRPQGA